MSQDPRTVFHVSERGELRAQDDPLLIALHALVATLQRNTTEVLRLQAQLQEHDEAEQLRALQLSTQLRELLHIQRVAAGLVRAGMHES